MTATRPKVWLIHGFNVSDSGAGTTDRLNKYVSSRGNHAREFDYGWIGLLGARFGNRRIATRLVDAVLTDDEELDPRPIGIGHSNGCAILHMASHMGAPFKKLIYINPALNKDAVPGKQVEEVHIWHSPSDKAVRFARFLPWHTWGEMGATGYRGDDMRMHNHDKERDYRLSSKTHSDVFHESLLDFFGPLIAP